MGNRNITIGAVWADGAADVPPNPIAEVTYKDSGLSIAEIHEAFAYKKIADGSRINEILYRATGLLLLLEQNGVLPWSELTTYPSGGRCLGSDGKLYRSKAAGNLNHNPISTSGYWDEEDLLSHIALTSGVHGATPTPAQDKIAMWDVNRRLKAQPGATDLDVVTMAQFAGTKATNGILNLPNGWKMQIATVAPILRNISYDFGNILYPEPFPTACLIAIPVLDTRDTCNLTEAGLAIDFSLSTKSYCRLYGTTSNTENIQRTYGAKIFAFGY